MSEEAISKKKRGARYSHYELSLVTDYVSSHFLANPDYSDCIGVANNFNYLTGQGRDPAAIYMLVWRIINGFYSDKFPEIKLTF